VASLPPSQHARKPAPERWCVNEVARAHRPGRATVRDIARHQDRNAKAAGLTSKVDAPAMLGDQMRTVVEDRSATPNGTRPRGC
jgi:hypothetical protein